MLVLILLVIELCPIYKTFRFPEKSLLYFPFIVHLNTFFPDFVLQCAVILAIGDFSLLEIVNKNYFMRAEN